MLGKVILTGKSFGQTCAYLCQELSRAQILKTEGVRLHDYGLMARDFEAQHQRMATKEKPVFHAVLSFRPGEVVDDRLLVELGEKYIEKMRLADTQYAFVKHTDRRHLHMHVVANRVDNHGEPTAKGLVIEQSIKVARELTKEYGFQQDEGKRLEMTQMNALHEPDVKRYRIYEAIRDVLPRCRGMDELEGALREKGVEMRIRVDERTGERQGVSFRLENRSFKGSRVDKEYSLARLGRRLAQQQKMQQDMEVGQEREEEMVLRLKESMKRRETELPTVTELRLALERSIRKDVPVQEESQVQEEMKEELRPRLRHGLR
jgi:hypothetical protein